MRVLFWGHPEFAAAPLRALFGEGFDVIGVVTQPDKPQGRSRKLVAPPVKQIALDEKIPCLPASQSDATTSSSRRSKRCSPISPSSWPTDTFFRSAFIDLPKLGTLNIHASLLPSLRGAAPIQAASGRASGRPA